MKKLLIILMITISLFITGCGCDKTKETIKLDDKGKTETKVEIEKVTFSDIKLEHDSGITTLTSTMKNNTKEDMNFEVKITLKDDSGKVQKEMTQKVENLKSSRTKILQVGIIGNYSYIKNVEFEIITN